MRKKGGSVNKNKGVKVKTGPDRDEGDIVEILSLQSKAAGYRPNLLFCFILFLNSLSCQVLFSILIKYFFLII